MKVLSLKYAKKLGKFSICECATINKRIIHSATLCSSFLGGKMIQGKSVLAIIPARGGSKGVTRKNVQTLGGKPLIAWTIEAAKKSRYLDRTVLSSDDEEIISAAREWGCEVPFLRPASLAQDTTPGIDPILHALEIIPEYDLVMMLQPTSPLRLPEDIDGCLELLISKRFPSCVSVTVFQKSPAWIFSISPMGTLLPIFETASFPLRRQDSPQYHILNGAVYVAEVPWLKKNRSYFSNVTGAYPMPPERSLDIDSIFDFTICQFIASNQLYLKKY